MPEIAADNAGHAYLLGPVFYGAVDFGETNFTTTCSIGFFLAAYTSSGGLAWARVVENVYAAALVVDGTGNSLVTGVCGGDSFGTTNFTSTGNMSIFTAKFDPAGNVLWIKGTPGPGTGFNAPKAIALGPSGDFYLCGEFEARNISFGSFTLTNSGDFDVFVVCCDFSGGVLWARQGGGTNRELAIGLSVDAAGACYLTGAIDNNGGAVLHGSALFGGCMIEDVNFFLVKYSLDGEVLWCRKAGVFSIDPTVGLEGAVLRSSGDADGNSYLLGQFYSIATFDTIALTNRGVRSLAQRIIRHILRRS